MFERPEVEVSHQYSERGQERIVYGGEIFYLKRKKKSATPLIERLYYIPINVCVCYNGLIEKGFQLGTRTLSRLKNPFLDQIIM